MGCCSSNNNSGAKPSFDNSCLDSGNSLSGVSVKSGSSSSEWLGGKLGLTRGSGSSEKGSLNDIASKKLKNSRESFRQSLVGSRFKVEWGVDAHSVNSKWRERRLSDTSLQSVMGDKEICGHFRAYLQELGEGAVLDTWLAIDKFDRLVRQREAQSTSSNKLAAIKEKSSSTAGNSCSSSEPKQGDSSKSSLLVLAQNVYTGHFKEDMVSDTMLGLLSSSTLADVRSELIVNDSGVMLQENLHVVTNVFRVLHLRVHNVLKYEYLPGFLGSDSFQTLASGSDEPSLRSSSFGRAEAADANTGQYSEGEDQSRTRCDSDIMDMLRNQSTSKYFYEYIFNEARNFGGHMRVVISNGGSGRKFFKADTPIPEKSLTATTNHAIKGAGNASLSKSELELLGLSDNKDKSSGADPRDRSSSRASAHGDRRARNGLSGSFAGDRKVGLRRQSRSLLKQLDIVELNLEIDDLLDPTAGPEAKLKRLNLILSRYGPLSQDLVSPPIESLQELYVNLNIAKRQLTELPSEGLETLIEPVRSEIFERIKTQLLPSFKHSSTFRSMESERNVTRGSSASIMTLDSIDEAMGEKHSKNKSDQNNTVAMLQSLKDGLNTLGPQHFASSQAACTRVTLEQVLEDNYGILQLKRFARKRFQEENILFLLEVAHLKENTEVTHKAGLYDLLHRAQYICDQFVSPGASLEINISDSQRTQALADFQACSSLFVRNLNVHGSNKAAADSIDKNGSSNPPSPPPMVEGGPDSQQELVEISVKICKAFDVAYAEVHSLVRKELWEEFRGSDLYKDFCRKRGAHSTNSGKFAPLNVVANVP